MVARFCGATLGILAFTITIIAGLFVGNPVQVTLSRSVVALFIFFGIGLLLGGAAQLVIAEHEENQEAGIRRRYHEDSAGTEDDGRKKGPSEGEGESVAA